MEVIKTKKGCLSLLAGKSGMGKSTIAAFNCAEQIRQGASITFFSYEYCQSVIYNKLVAHFNLKWQELFNVDIVDSRGLSLDDIKTFIYKKKDELQYVYIDYLDLLREFTFPNEKDENKKIEDIQTIIATLANIANELNIGIVLLCQENAEASLEKSAENLNLMSAKVPTSLNMYKMLIGRDEILNPMINNNDISYVIIVDGYNLKHFSSINLKEAYKN